MKKLMVLAIVVLSVAAVFASDDYPWIEKFHKVDIIAAAQYRTNWQTNQVDWTKGEKQGTDSIIYVPVVLNADGGWGHKMYCHFVRVDTHDKRVRLTGMDRCADWCAKRMPSPHENQWRYTLKEPTADFIARYRGSKADGGKGRNMRLAYNATGWGPTCGHSGEYWATINSPYYADSVRIGAYPAGGTVTYPGCGVLVAWKDGTIEIVDELKEEDEKKIWTCHPGFQKKLVTKGVNVVEGDKDSFCTAVRPRTSVGMSQDKRYMYVIVVDGDHPTEWCDGCNLSTLARMFLFVGAYEAFNCDGGGSSNMVTWDDEQNKPRMMGRPSDGNSFKKSTQRSGSSHMGVYLASIVAKIGTFTYDEWGFLLQDVADGEVPDGVTDIDVLADLTLATTADLPSGYALDLADGVTLTVAAGVRAPVRGGSGAATVVTADAAGFVLDGALGGTLGVRCATAAQEGAVFGSSTLSLAKTRAELGKIRCADNASLVAVASGTDGAVVLSWGRIAIGSTQATVRANDTKADIAVEILSGGTYEGEAKTIRLTLTDDRTGASTVHTKDLSGAGTYTFAVTGADFGYTYAVELLDGAGAVLEKMRATDEIIFARLDDWFSADVVKGTKTGGDWTTFDELEKVFEAAEGGKGGFVRVMALASSISVCDDTSLPRTLTQALSKGVPQAAMTVSKGTGGCRWHGLVDEDGSPAWRTLVGTSAPQEETAYVMMQEVSFDADKKPHVRYFSGDAGGKVLELLKDASGRSSFAGPSTATSVEGVVRFLGEMQVAGIRATCADKDGAPGVILFLR